MQPLYKYNTWEFYELLKKKRALFKWIYHLKIELNGRKRWKPRFVMDGFSQNKGVYFNEIFAPMDKLTNDNYPILLAIVDSKGLFLEQMDVNCENIFSSYS